MNFEEEFAAYAQLFVHDTLELLQNIGPEIGYDTVSIIFSFPQ